MRANLTPRRAIAAFSFCTRSRHPCAMPVPAATATPSDPAHAPLTGLPRVAPPVAEKLAARGMSTLQDLLLPTPRLAWDRPRPPPIRGLRGGWAARVGGRVGT